MLLEDAQENRRYCKMMVSQPRRIAASSLMKRVRSTLGMQVNNNNNHISNNYNIFFLSSCNNYKIRLVFEWVMV